MDFPVINPRLLQCRPGSLHYDVSPAEQGGCKRMCVALPPAADVMIEPAERGIKSILCNGLASGCRSFPFVIHPLPRCRRINGQSQLGCLLLRRRAGDRDGPIRFTLRC